jgi:hypothetical protein
MEFEDWIIAISDGLILLLLVYLAFIIKNRFLVFLIDGILWLIIGTIALIFLSIRERDKR